MANRGLFPHCNLLGVCMGILERFRTPLEPAFTCSFAAKNPNFKFQKLKHLLLQKKAGIELYLSPRVAVRTYVNPLRH
jgi:hypothetical protein